MKEFLALAVLAAGVAWNLAVFPAGSREAFPGLLRSFWPVGPHIFSNLSWSAECAVFALLLIFIWDAVGLRLAVLVLGRRPAGALRPVAVFAGFASFSAMSLGLAAVGLWFVPVIAGVLVLAGAFALPESRRVAGEWRDWLGRFWGDSSPAGLACWLVVGVWLMLLLFPPELAIDCLEYHLTYPQQMLTTHRLIGTDVYLGCPMPIATDFTNAFPLAFGLDSAVKMTRPFLLAAGVVAFIRALRLPVSPAWEPAIALFALLVPAARNFSFFSKSDGVLAGLFPAVCAMLLESGVLVRGGSASAGILFSASLLAGFAMSSKYVVLPMMGMLGAFVFYRVSHGERIKSAALMLAGASIPLIPWMARSFLYFNDPLYPVGSIYLSGFFGDPDTNGTTRYAYLAFIQEGRPMSAFIYETAWFAARNAFPLAAGALFLRGRLPAGACWLGGAVLAGMGAIFFAIRGGADFAERYSFPLYIVANAAGAVGLVACSRRARLLLPAVISAFAVLATAWQIWFFPGVLPGSFLAGRESREEFRNRGMYAYGAILPAVKQACLSGRGVLVTLGNRIMWDIPVRVVGEGFEPPFVWRSARDSDTPGRLVVKFRQRNARWILHNGPLEGWYRFTRTPFEWRPRMFRLYMDFAQRHLRLVATSGRCDPLYGNNWLYEVLPSPAPPLRRIIFLPGSEGGYAFASLAQLNGYSAMARERFDALRRIMPAVVAIDGMEAEVLAALGDWRGAYRLAKGSAEEGLLDETNLLIWAVSAGKLERKNEAAQALARAQSAYPLFPERVAKARADAGLGGAK